MTKRQARTALQNEDTARTITAAAISSPDATPQSMMDSSSQRSGNPPSPPANTAPHLLDWFSKGVYPLFMIVGLIASLTMNAYHFFSEHKMERMQEKMQSEIDKLQVESREHQLREKQLADEAQWLRVQFLRQPPSNPTSSYDTAAWLAIHQVMTESAEKKRIGNQADEMWKKAKDEAIRKP